MQSYEFVKQMRATLTRVEDLIDVKHPEIMPVDEIRKELGTLRRQSMDMTGYIETQREG